MPAVSFKSFLGADTVRKKAQTVAKQLLDVDTVEELDHIEFSKIDGAKEVGHKFIDTKDGPWVATALKKKGETFVQVVPPKDLDAPTMYFVNYNTED